VSGPKLQHDAAQIVLWFRDLPQPTSFVTTRIEAEEAVRVFSGNSGPDSNRQIDFQSYPGGDHRSRTVVPCRELRALTIEWPSIKLS
jgi:hypothetical protein